MKRIYWLPLLFLIVVSCGISEADVQATIAALPTQTSAVYTSHARIEVHSTIKDWAFSCLLFTNDYHCNALTIEVVGGNSTSACTIPTSDNCELPVSRSFTIQTGDEVSVTLTGLQEFSKASCGVYMGGELVSSGEVDGIGAATCEATAP